MQGTSEIAAGKPRGWNERLGQAVGYAIAPIVGLIARIRRARMFHPDGVTFAAEVRPIAGSPDGLPAVADRLLPAALVRLSSAWWKSAQPNGRRRKDWPDVLGIAVRFTAAQPESHQAQPGDQDLLFATVRFPITTPLAPLATNFTSFLWNHFYAASPFEIAGLGRTKIRLRSPRTRNTSDLSRAEHLTQQVASGHAVYVLELRLLDRSILRRRWQPVVQLALTHPVDINQSALRFSPFRDGRGLSPVGFVHRLRVATYAASQSARPG